MSRLPQVGDFVLIEYLGKNFTTKIISITGLILNLIDQQSNNATALTWNGTEWLLPGGIKPTSVNFVFSYPVTPREELLNNSPIQNQEDANRVAGNGNVNLLQWMKENNLPLPNLDGTFLAAGRGYVNVLQWMKENNLPLPDSSAAHRAISNGHLNVLQWMKENNLPFPNKQSIKFIVNINPNISQWLKENNFL